MKFITRQILFATITAALATPVAFATTALRETSAGQGIRFGSTSAPAIALELDHEMRGLAGLRLSAYENLRAHASGSSLVSTISASGAPVRTTTSSAATSTIVTWTFENSGVGSKQTAATGTSGTPDSSYGLGDTGTLAGTSGVNASTHHTNDATYSFTTGNGSASAYAATNWSSGNYWQFQLSTANFQGITISFDQRGSDTGPKDWILQYSTTGAAGTFTTFDTDSATAGVQGYTVANSSWSSTTVRTSGHFTFDLSGISGLDNNANVVFRLVDNSTSNITGGTVGAGGTDVVDNFSVLGTAFTPVPEPSTWVGAGLAVAAIGWMQRRRLLALLGIA